MDAATLEKARDYAFTEGMNTQGVVIIRGGAIVAEWYAPGSDKDSFAASWSAGKSVTSAIFGIAKDEGLIGSVDESMSNYFPEWAGTDKEPITLRSVLQMQSGLDFVEDYADLATSDVIAMGFRADVLDYVKSQLPTLTAPNLRWSYSSGDTMLLGGVIEAATGQNATDYGRQKLFDPLGMAPLDWWVDGAGHTLTFCCVDTPSRQFAKLGLLFMRGGEWDGQRIISEEWVRESTTSRASGNPGYAYQWWLAEEDDRLPKDSFMALGLDNQQLYVIPSLDLIAVRNGTYTKPPGEAVAPEGFLKKFGPRGTKEHGTLAPELDWSHDIFLSHVINSIEGADRVDLP